MPGYDAGQLKVIRTINRRAAKRYANDPAKRRRYALGGLAIAKVESGFRNLNHGDADSVNFRQERASIYGGDMNLRRITDRMFDEMEQHDRGQSVGELAADIQRPRADLRGRYAEELGSVKGLAKGGGAAGGGTDRARGQLTSGRAPRFNAGEETTNSKGAMLAALLDKRKGMSLLERYQGQVATGNYTTSVGPSVTPGKNPTFTEGAAGDGPPTPGKRGLMARADAIDKKQYNYAWGGGHNPGNKPSKGVGHGSGPAAGYDCSGAVAKLLGIDARVSGEFMKWGKPGRGKNFTIYANPTHVLVEIGGHFWGTSGDNPGGGAGWIPRSKISKAYLSKFTARH